MKKDTRPLILHVIHHLVTGGMENGLINLINNLPESRFRHAVACIEDFSDFRLRLTRVDTPVTGHRSGFGGLDKASFACAANCDLQSCIRVTSRGLMPFCQRDLPAFRTAFMGSMAGMSVI